MNSIHQSIAVSTSRSGLFSLSPIGSVSTDSLTCVVSSSEFISDGPDSGDTSSSSGITEMSFLSSCMSVDRSPSSSMHPRVVISSRSAGGSSWTDDWVLKERRRGGSVGGSRVMESTLRVSASLSDSREMVGCGVGVRLGAKANPETRKSGLVRAHRESHERVGG